MFKKIEIPLGIVTGAALTAVGIALYKGESVWQALQNNMIVAGLAGVILTAVIYSYEKKRKAKDESNI
jgi:hypothetical protein